MTITSVSGIAEVASDGRYCWVNVNGIMVARFGPRGAELADEGVVRTETTAEDWSPWVAAVRERYGVEVADEHRPAHAGGVDRDTSTTEPVADPVEVEPERETIGRWLFSRLFRGAR